MTNELFCLNRECYAPPVEGLGVTGYSRFSVSPNQAEVSPDAQNSGLSADLCPIPKSTTRLFGLDQNATPAVFSVKNCGGDKNMILRNTCSRGENCRKYWIES
jgi:hypothetical protein